MIAIICKFTPNDYAAIAAINNVIWIDEPITGEQWQQDDVNRDPKCKHARWVAELDGKVVGFCEYDQLAGRYHPDHYWLRIEVLPEFRRRGIGAALYDQVITAVSELKPELVRIALRENMPDQIRFVTQRGFTEDWRSWEMRLNVETFDPTPYAGAEEKLRAKGIEIKTLDELASDPDCDHKLHELHEETRADTPSRIPSTRMDFDRWKEWFLNGHAANNAACFVAVRDGEYLGFSALNAAKPGANIDTRWAGVRRAERRQGIALALKMRMIEYAKAHGHPYIMTVTHSLNVPVQTMNNRMGYVSEPAWVYYVKKMTNDK